MSGAPYCSLLRGSGGSEAPKASHPRPYGAGMLFATRCAGCEALGPSPCRVCVEELRPLGEVTVPGLERCWALVDYDELSRRFVGQLKYRGVRTAVPWLGKAMANQVTAGGAPVDLVTWMPAAVGNRRRRGFDQAEALARPLARHLGLPLCTLLRRSDRSGQTGATRQARLAGPHVRSRHRIGSANVLVVDDVLTSGGSMMAAARALRAAGARQVYGVVAAHRRFV